MEKFIFRQKVIEFLKEHKEEQYTAIDIANKLAEKYPAQRTEKLNNSHNENIKTEADVNSQWAREIGANLIFLKEHGILITPGRPRKYYYSENNSNDSSGTTDNTQVNSKKRKNNQPEKELYQTLIDFCGTLNIKAMRIDEKKSLKSNGKNYNVWLHPDIVGFKYIGADFCKEAADCLSTFPEKSYFYSFEVKDGQITVGNLRESFFQTVSNSSWANYSYLVAEGIENDEAEEELRLLCESFKIGFIELNKEYPAESKIIIQAPKKQVDWNMINRIAKTENKDFIKYLENIKIEHGSPRDTNWDKPTIYEKEEDDD